mmetsp:Transcript_39610/g.86470  ORF Transcript_39610/g.86470 Transcript_39610/m.86470 type:complete len:241 (-) Transcript_39610:69-791(-)
MGGLCPRLLRRVLVRTLAVAHKAGRSPCLPIRRCPRLLPSPECRLRERRVQAPCRAPRGRPTSVRRQQHRRVDYSLDQEVPPRFHLLTLHGSPASSLPSAVRRPASLARHDRVRRRRLQNNALQRLRHGLPMPAKVLRFLPSRAVARKLQQGPKVLEWRRLQFTRGEDQQASRRCALGVAWGLSVQSRFRPRHQVSCRLTAFSSRICRSLSRSKGEPVLRSRSRVLGRGSRETPPLAGID